MFKLAKQSKIKWPVTVNVPQDGGTTKKHQFNADFELISQEEYDAFYAENGERDIGLARRVLTGWDGVADAEGNPIDFNGDTKEMMVRIPYVRTGIVTAFIECLYGKAAAKN